MTNYLIYIYIDQKPDQRGYKVGEKSLTVKVTERKPYDSSSKLFKKLTHTINYPRGSYKASEYSIEIFDPYAHFQKYLLKYSTPVHKVESIDIFFRHSDDANRTPLILVFHQEKRESLYYTAGFLYSYTSLWVAYRYIKDFLPNRSFPKTDLTTKLLEELGPHVSGRDKKLVIRLNEKVVQDRSIKYPKTGHHTDKVTVTKSKESEYPSYDKYVHTIDSTSNAELFYISFDNDSLFLDNNPGLKKLQKVDVYFNKTKQTPVLIMFTFERGTKIYRYTEFLKDVTNSDNSKKINKLQDFNNILIPQILVEETKKVNKEITFQEGSQKNQNILEKTDEIGDETKFTKLILMPNTDGSTQGSKNGPWNVYNGNLFTKETDAKIDVSVLTGIIGKNLTEIIVYYNKTNKALMVEFHDLKKTFFKRKNKEGTLWEKENNIIKGTDEELITKLNQIESEILKEQSVSGGTDRNTFQQTDSSSGYEPQTKDEMEIVSPITEINVETIVGIVGGVIALLGGGGGGYWWYKR